MNTGRQEDGLILITALFMLASLIGLVMICTYPLTHERLDEVRHHNTLNRWKTMERGAFGRLAHQPGGKFNACGGYFSDTGMKVKRRGERGEVRRMLEYYKFKKDNSVITEKYRYDGESGFWVGYRGKRYTVRPPGEEHLLKKVYGTRGVDTSNPRPILVDGYKNPIEYSGYGSWIHYSESEESDGKKHATRLYNPVDKLVVTIAARRSTGTLSVELIYAEQPEGKMYGVETELGVPQANDLHTFVFEWKNPDPICPGAVFQMGLKKLVIYEDGNPRLTQAICLPPVRKFRSRNLDYLYKDLYQVTVAYE
jgi:hypothetical protein